MNDEELTIFRRRNIGFVFQNYNLVPILNVYENIVLPIELDGSHTDKKYVDTIINTLGLEDEIMSMPNQLSGGRAVPRVAIASSPFIKAVQLFSQMNLPEILTVEQAWMLFHCLKLQAASLHRQS